MNKLEKEKSLYLQQHANNPVDWLPWGDEAFEISRSSNKPILLSIGYSACHWCHVMAHESFEDEDIAEIMNKNFVNIKLDREERPDLDKIYQTAQTIITGKTGGWPLTVFMTPEKMPFFAGTYFPPDLFAGICRENLTIQNAGDGPTILTPADSTILAIFFSSVAVLISSSVNW